MLKLKKGVKGKQLEKLGFISTSKEIYWSLGTKRIIIAGKTNMISINSPNNMVYDKLYELISAGYVEMEKTPLYKPHINYCKIPLDMLADILNSDTPPKNKLKKISEELLK